MTATSAATSLPYHKRPSTCLPCAQRKVRCDRAVPCAACEKSHIACTYERQERLPKKRRLDASHKELYDKIDLYEQALRSAGIPFPNGIHDAVDDQNRVSHDMRDRMTRDPELRPILTDDGAGKRYYEQTMLSDILRTRDELTKAQSGTDEPFSVGCTTSSDEDGDFHNEGRQCLAAGLCPLALDLKIADKPNVDEILNLIQVFYNHVNPLLALIPRPIGLEKLRAAAKAPNHASSAEKALLFAACTCALVSNIRNCSSNAKDRGRSKLLLGYFHHATWKGLMRASLLRSSDPTVLQAFLLLLTSMQHDHDAVVVWTLLGLAVRQAQRMGLHRDGTFLGLSPYETELRRRIWWYLINLDLRITEVSGCARVISRDNWDTRMPLNIDDAIMDPAMVTTPQESVGFTDMTFCLMQYQITQAIRRHRDWLKSVSEMSKDLETFHLSSSYNDAKGAITKVAELQDNIESRYLRFCDPIVPLHNFATNMTRSMLAKFRIISLMCRSEAGNVERLRSSVRIVQYNNLIHSTRSNHGFMWYAESHFEGGALLQLLKRLSVGAGGTLNVTTSATDGITEEQLENAWLQLEEFFQNNPEYAEPSEPFMVAVAKKAVDAWKKESQRRADIKPEKSIKTPDFVNVMETALNQLLGETSPMNQEILSKEPTAWNLDKSKLDTTETGPQLLDSFPLGDAGMDIDPWLSWDETLKHFEFSSEWP